MTREEAIKIINCYDIGFCDLSGEKIPADKLVDAFGMAVEALQADRPRGEWLDVNGDGSLWECTNCHDKACCKGNFCSGCGSRMGVEE